MKENRAQDQEALQSQEILDAIREITALVAGKSQKLIHLQKQFTMPQIVVINLLSRHERLRINDLAEGAHCAASTISGIVDRLERDGVVERVRSPEDRRVVYVSLSEKSREVAQRQSEDFSNSLIRNAKPGEVEQVLDGLRVFRDMLMREGIS